MHVFLCIKIDSPASIKKLLIVVAVGLRLLFAAFVANDGCGVIVAS